MIGPFRGGRSNGVTGVPGQPNHFYFGSVGGGVWESINSGETWTPIFDAEHVQSIGAIAVAPSESECNLRRHRRSRHALANFLRQRNVQIHRRRQNLDAHRSRRHAADRPHHRRSARSESRFRRRARPRLRPECRARRVSFHRWRRDVAENSVQG